MGGQSGRNLATSRPLWYAQAMLRFRADLRTLAFVGSYFASVAAAWTWVPPLSLLAIPVTLTICVLSFLCAVITHNTIHCPVFKQRWLNRLFQLALTLSYGHPVSAYVPGHNLSHHKHTQSRKDVMRTTKTRFQYNLWNLLFFMPTVGRDIARADMRYFTEMRRRNPPWFRQMALEWAVFGGVMLALIFTDISKFFVFVMIPHLYAAWGIVTMNLLQHDGADENTEWNHSRNFVGKAVNWWTFNNGYHTIHHIEPGLHWSLTPAAHAERVAPFIHPALDQASLPAYIWQAFIKPGKRLMYDGSPVVLPAPGPDEEWIPSPKDMPADVSLGAVG